MSQVTGVVKAVSIKNETKSGKKLKSPLFSVNVDDSWYSFGFKNPNINRGDNVTFNFSTGQFGEEADASTVEINSRASASTTSSAPATASSDRQDSIVYQSSRKDAIQVVSILLENEAITLPTKKGDKMEAIMSLIDEITGEYAFEALSPVISAPAVSVQESIDE